MPKHLSENDVLKAADLLVDAFRSNDRGRYFGSFAESATFIFYSEPQFPWSKADYEQQWQSWIDGGWRVVACTSSSQQVQIAGETAVFSHIVDTVISQDGLDEASQERETIVFAVESDRLLAIHEHLSVLPQP